jgi:AAA+ ATPase superfamily predicted ATPase
MNVYLECLTMQNPFLFGKIVTGAHFCNRDKEKELLEENLKGGQSVVIISPRRMGKSSLLAVVSNSLTAQGILCGRVDFLSLKSVPKILNAIIRMCAEMMLKDESNIKRFLKVSGEIFKRTRIAIEPSGDGSGFSVRPEISLPVDVRGSLREALGGLDDFLGKKHKNGVIILDEFQEILAMDRQDDHSLEAEFRTVIQTTRNLAFAFLGSRATVLSEMFTDKQRPFFQAAKILSLGPIDTENLSNYVEERFNSAGVQIKHAEKIPIRVQGHPDYTQRLSSHVFDLVSVNKIHQRPLVLDDQLLNQAMEQMLEACMLIFIPEWEGYPLRQQQVLSLLADHGPLKRIPALFLAEYEMSNTTFNTAVKQLLRKGTVKLDEEGRYEITDPIFGKWIRENR